MTEPDRSVAIAGLRRQADGWIWSVVDLGTYDVTLWSLTRSDGLRRRAEQNLRRRWANVHPQNLTATADDDHDTVQAALVAFFGAITVWGTTNGQ